MKKSAIILILAAAVCLGACTAASAAVQESTAPVSGTEAPAAPAEEAPSFPDTEEQKALLEANREIWAFREEYETPWYYTFTDLDHNGRLEVIAATVQGTGFYTYANIFEVSADGTGITDCAPANPYGDGPYDWPEITLNTLPCYYDAAADRYYYVCEDYLRDGYAHRYLSLQAFSLKDGGSVWELLASKDLVYADGSETAEVTCTAPDGSAITEQEYDSAAERRFAGMERSDLILEWTEVGGAGDPGDAITLPPLDKIA